MENSLAFDQTQMKLDQLTAVDRLEDSATRVAAYFQHGFGFDFERYLVVSVMRDLRLICYYLVLPWYLAENSFSHFRIAANFGAAGLMIAVVVAAAVAAVVVRVMSPWTVGTDVVQSEKTLLGLVAKVFCLELIPKCCSLLVDFD